MHRKDDVEPNGTKDLEWAPLNKAEHTQYQAIAARLNYMAPDRPDLTVTTMGACSRMAAPTQADWIRLKRIGRYLLHRPRAGCLFRWQKPGVKLHVHSDSDWAGDKATRRSVSGGAVFNGQHLIKTWSKQQHVVSMSSAEAELYAASKCGEWKAWVC